MVSGTIPVLLSQLPFFLSPLMSQRLLSGLFWRIILQGEPRVEKQGGFSIWSRVHNDNWASQKMDDRTFRCFHQEYGHRWWTSLGGFRGILHTPTGRKGTIRVVPEFEILTILPALTLNFVTLIGRPSATAVFVGRQACFTCGRVLVVLGWLLGRFTFKIWVRELSF